MEKYYIQYVYSDMLIGPFASVDEAKVEIKRRKKGKKNFTIYRSYPQKGLVEVKSF